MVLSCSPGLKNLQYYKQDVEKYYESGRYGLEVRGIYDGVIEDINDLPPVVNPTVVFDVDETTLSNYDHIKAISFGYFPGHWEKWLDKADGKAILQTKYFYDYLIERNYKIVFLTARSVRNYEATYTNLVNEGFTQFDTLICRPMKSPKLPSAVFKENERKKLSSSGYNIVACVGDQESDLMGKYTGIKVKLPNYIYIVE